MGIGHILLIKYLGRPHTRGESAISHSIDFENFVRGGHSGTGGQESRSGGLPLRPEILWAAGDAAHLGPVAAPG
jgi:hypothetical protein